MTILDPKGLDDLASEIAAEVMGNDHLAHRLDEQQADEVHGDVQDIVARHVTAYLAALPPAGELVPVAWRWRYDDPVHDGHKIGWFYGSSQTALSRPGHDWPGWECEPLYDAATIAALQAALGEAERRFRDEHAIVDRIWAMLGRPSYEELAGRSIYDLIGELKARIKGMETALQFYADPDSYFGMGFFADRPAGGFADDFDYDEEYERTMPGKLARNALSPQVTG